jgi:5-carboxymethyl-2-hydroxymuconate isomerase
MNTQTIKTTPTPEQLEYDELTKKMRLATAKLRIAQEGVDVSSISQQNMDKIMRIFDDTEHAQRDVQQKTSKIQQDANIQTQKVNQDAGKKFGDIQKRYQDLIKSLKEGHHQEIKEEQVVQDVVAQPIIEGVREKTHDDKVSEITDIVLRAMRDTVYKRVDEIMKTVDTRAEITIGRGVDASQEVTEELVDHTKQMTVESAIIGSGDKPDDKDIPTIVPETMKKTGEDN